MYQKVIDDKLVILPMNKITVTDKDGITWFNPSHEMLIEDCWEVYNEVVPEMSEAEKVKAAKDAKINEISHYDASDNINVFFMNNMPIWLDKATRAGLMLRFQSELALKKDTTTLWYNNMHFDLPLNDAMTMLYVIENYASQCYDTTQAHIAAVSALETIDEIRSYNYITGYPEKLHF